jgi:hypothetical protein
MAPILFEGIDILQNETPQIEYCYPYESVKSPDVLEFVVTLGTINFRPYFK